MTLLFRATDRIGGKACARGVSGWLSGGEETNYQKFLAFNDTITIERGMRSEVDKATALSLYRNRNTMTGFCRRQAQRLRHAKTSKTNICVNPNR